MRVLLLLYLRVYTKRYGRRSSIASASGSAEDPNVKHQWRAPVREDWRNAEIMVAGSSTACDC
jgi:hypothetical protein